MQGILFGGVIIVLFFVGVVLMRIVFLERKLRRLFGGKREKTLEALVYAHAEALSEAQDNIKKLDDAQKALEDVVLDAVQKVAIVRFNPFPDSGGDQSFAIAFLDGNNTGVVLSSLYSHNRQLVYAKPIEKGASRYALSAEEQTVLNRAMRQ
ncbi:MAG: hypothetical protein A3F26_01325 [Candidatus Ryanbacteria bacterium RIFCSPHIGHO2_12_FULL_47_12b]|uniref:DUF4446 domain-containing protein n=2 Tax=Candidatus Ryaniibacteriota TaxID=1817914 RepID=A0A1G2H252_9BACT|nr:MAG: hypothetical protein A3F26_01325 [Candidatus Ryanbacteria bacterium RIFCSPHIGHO2_12_FULL_47_12b]OGZ56144.1 MAG: hypothetical protein A3J04_00265 [Candidatus Ryanbacteria bacterium RIFCSPLOWO2_02_FULL_47_14]OGZ56566.1 MAG: hypothetical protein A3G60_00965 [Candidatus Ryanbacteria bacterium RIFCSPLOWO2_12_FULL_47_9c]